MMEYRQEFFKGERALFGADGVTVYDSVFDEGESPLKESRNVEIYNSQFKYKYPLWYAENVKVIDCNWLEMARSGVWYTRNITVKNALGAAVAEQAAAVPQLFPVCGRITAVSHNSLLPRISADVKGL